jgi:hypothetical protein
MTDLRTAAKQALKALETCDAAPEFIYESGRQWYDDKAVEEAIATLRAALEQDAVEHAAQGARLDLGSRQFTIPSVLRDELLAQLAKVNEHKATIKALTLWLEVNQRAALEEAK